MKTRSWAKFSTAFAFSLLWASCSSDWGHVDPPAATDVAPTLEKVCEYTFDDEGGLDASVFTVVPYPDGSMPVLRKDDMTESVVLDLTGGYAKIKNPLAPYEVQKGVSLTFWMKQVSDSVYDENGVATGKVIPQDVTTPFLHWENLNASATFDFSTNGWINYSGIDGKQSLDDPSEYKTGYITPDEWHYVALIVRNDGYGLYVDGQKKAEQVTEKSLASAVQLLAKAENLYINYGASTHSKYLIDDLKLYRNLITDKEIARPQKGKIGKDDEGDEPKKFDPRKWIGVGLEDCSTPWWSPETFSPVVPLVGDGKVHFGFYNYNNGTANNYCNWIAVMTHGAKAFGQDGYGEYFVLRSDAYGWGELYNGDNISHDFNWDTFCKEMDGAWVDLTFERTGEHVDMTAVITTSDNQTRKYSFYVDGVTEETIGFFLLCEGSYLKLDVAEAVVNGEVFAPKTYGVGLEDCSTPWWTPSTFSKLYKFDTKHHMPFSFTFYNYNNGTTNNFCNWIVVCTNGKAFGEDGYAEYFVLRSDAYGWGSAYNGDNISHGFNWDTFCGDMDGAYVRLFLEYENDEVVMTAKVISDDGTPQGKALQDYTFSAPGITGEIGFFLLCEGSYLDVRSVGYTPFRNQAN